MPLIDDILAQPEEDRLGMALEAIRWLTADDTSLIARYGPLGLTGHLTAVLHTLVEANGRTVSKERLQNVLEARSGKVRIADPTVDITRLRNRLPGTRIESVWGIGWRLPASDRDALIARFAPADARPRRPMGERSTTNHNEAWTPEDDETLRLMRANGSEWWAIAHDLNRTERGCMERHMKLKKRK